MLLFRLSFSYVIVEESFLSGYLVAAKIMSALRNIMANQRDEELHATFPFPLY